MSVSALQTAIWSLKVTNIIAPGKTVEDGEIFVAHIARCGKRRHKLIGTVEDGDIMPRVSHAPVI